MKIVLAGGGTGGHFYPLIAVAEALEDIVKERRLIEPELYYIGPKAFDGTALQEHEIEYRPTTAGKVRQYRSILNFLDIFKTGWGIVIATWQLFRLYPDAVFSTGGYAAFPTLFAAKVLKIPTIIYDADATPGKVSLWSSKFAQWIAVAHGDAAEKFPKKTLPKIAQTGHPIRKEIEGVTTGGGHEFLKLDPTLPTVFIMGGSSGSVAINEAVLDALPVLLPHFNVVHQTGSTNLEDVQKISGVELKDLPAKDHYRPFGLLNTLAIRMAAGISSVIVARAGSGTIFEIASWGVPAILVPLPIDVSHDQTENAFSYARSGAAVVIEQQNLTPHVLASEIERISGDKELRAKMSAAAKAFARRDAARKIAQILIETTLPHSSV